MVLVRQAIKNLTLALCKHQKWKEEVKVTKLAEILGFNIDNCNIRPGFLYYLVYVNFFQRSNVGGWNKNKNKMSQDKDIT